MILLPVHPTTSVGSFGGSFVAFLAPITRAVAGTDSYASSGVNGKTNLFHPFT